MYEKSMKGQVRTQAQNLRESKCLEKTHGTRLTSALATVVAAFALMVTMTVISVALPNFSPSFSAGFLGNLFGTPFTTPVANATTVQSDEEGKNVINFADYQSIFTASGTDNAVINNNVIKQSNPSNAAKFTTIQIVPGSIKSWKQIKFDGVFTDSNVQVTVNSVLSDNTSTPIAGFTAVNLINGAIDLTGLPTDVRSIQLVVEFNTTGSVPTVLSRITTTWTPLAKLAIKASSVTPSVRSGQTVDYSFKYSVNLKSVDNLYFYFTVAKSTSPAAPDAKLLNADGSELQRTTSPIVLGEVTIPTNTYYINQGRVNAGSASSILIKLQTVAKETLNGSWYDVTGFLAATNANNPSSATIRTTVTAVPMPTISLNKDNVISLSGEDDNYRVIDFAPFNSMVNYTVHYENKVPEDGFGIE